MEAAKNIFCTKIEGTVDYNTVTRGFHEILVRLQEP